MLQAENKQKQHRGTRLTHSHDWLMRHLASIVLQGTYEMVRWSIEQFSVRFITAFMIQGGIAIAISSL